MCCHADPGPFSSQAGDSLQEIQSHRSKTTTGASGVTSALCIVVHVVTALLQGASHSG